MEDKRVFYSVKWLIKFLHASKHAEIIVSDIAILTSFEVRIGVRKLY